MALHLICSTATMMSSSEESRPVLKGSQLVMIVPGQPFTELEAAKPCLFNIRGAPDSTVEFIKDAAGVVTEILIISPFDQLIFKKMK